MIKNIKLHIININGFPSTAPRLAEAPDCHMQQ
jgi:hypothetical protein